MPLAVLTFLTTVAYVPWLPSAPNVGRWTVMAVGAALLIWSCRVVWTWGHALGASSLAWGLVGLYWSVSPLDTLGELHHWIIAAVLFAVAAEVEERDVHNALRALAVGVTVSSLFALIQWAGLPTANSIVGYSGLWLSKNMAVEVSAVALVGALGLRFWWGVPGPLLGLYLAGGREGALLLAAAGIAWFWLKLDWFGRLVLPLLGLAAVNRLWSHGLLTSGWLKLDDRMEIWSFTLQHLRLMGWGLNTFGSLQTGYEFSHNDLLQYAFELGVGIILMVGVVAYALTAQRTLERVLLLVLGTACLVWYPLHAPGPVLLGSILAGYLCGDRGRALRLEPRRRGGVLTGDIDLGSLGIGAPLKADLLRLHLPAGPQPAYSSNQIRGTLA